ncbi:hypothetical protein [Streptacidiphilus sp. P02-A3a]|uniref:hypothetical protein n=1 Tax=Streptacidiphilus sp. P02-A3a TaxID=2704468 RepID=UPI00351A57FD
MVDTAFKPYRDILSTTPRFWPFPFTLANFTDAVRKPGFATDLANSAVVTGAVVAASVVLAFLAAVALTRFRFRGRHGFLIAVLVVQMVPQPALLIPVFLSSRAPTC